MPLLFGFLRGVKEIDGKRLQKDYQDTNGATDIANDALTMITTMDRRGDGARQGFVDLCK